MGFSLPTIREIVTKHAGSEELKQYLEAQAEETRGRIAAMQRQLNLVEKAIENFNHPSNIPTHNVTMKHFAERMVISYRNRIALPDQEGFLWEKLDEGVKSHHVQLAVPRLDLAIFHDESFIEQNLDVEVQRSVTGKYQDTDCIKFKSVAAFSAATLIYKGHYTKLPEAYEAIARWISDNHYQMFGPHFNIYHRSPETESSYENMVTEVCFPIKSI
jgi:effector-binding domain-containing protein